MSHIKIEAELLAKVCKRYLEKREQRLAEEREAMIQEEMARPRFFRSLLGRPPITREEAIAELSSDQYGEWHFKHLSGSYWGSKIMTLQRLAEVAIATGAMTVKLDAGTANVLHKSIKEVTCAGS